MLYQLHIILLKPVAQHIKTVSYPGMNIKVFLVTSPVHMGKVLHRTYKVSYMLRCFLYIIHHLFGYEVVVNPPQYRRQILHWNDAAEAIQVIHTKAKVNKVLCIFVVCIYIM